MLKDLNEFQDYLLLLGLPNEYKLNSLYEELYQRDIDELEILTDEEIDNYIIKIKATL